MDDQENRDIEENEKPDLESEASELRREKLFRRRGRGRKDAGTVKPAGKGIVRSAVYASGVLVLVLGAVILLAVPGLREPVARQLAGVFVPDPDNTLYDLPAPPPRSPRVSEQYRESPDFDPDEDILFSGSNTRQPEKIEPFGGEKQEAVKLPRTPGSRGAFAFMQEDDGKLGELLKGEGGSLKYQTWNLVSQEPPVYLIDVIAESVEDGSEQHLIFSVDMGKKEVTPLSQAARDFMR